MSFFVECEARAVNEFQAQEQDELSIEPGDVVKILEVNVGQSGWSRGEVNGKTGLFPSTSVRFSKLVSVAIHTSGGVQLG